MSAEEDAVSNLDDAESVDADDLNRAVDPYPEDIVDFDEVPTDDDAEAADDVDADDDGDDDDDDDDGGDDDDDDDDLDDLEDASADEVDFVVALYREDGQPVAVGLALDLANDLDELINQLRRLPGDSGAVGLVSISSEFLVLCKVRGPHVQVLLSDSVAANDWPLARDVAYFLGIDVPDPDDDSEPMGDLGMLEDLGVDSFVLEALVEDMDEDSDELAEAIADRMKFGPQFAKVVSEEH